MTQNLLSLQIRMIGGAHQGTRSYLSKPHGLGFFFQRFKLIRTHEAGYGQVMGAGLQVLPQSQHVAVMGAQIVHYRFHLFQGLAQSQHQAGFGGYVWMGGFEPPDKIQGPGIVGTGPSLFVETGDGLCAMW